MQVGLEHYLVVSFLLFALGLLGVIMRRNLLVIYMSLELMLNASSLRPKSTCKSPMENQFLEISVTVGCQPLALMKTSERTKPMIIAPMEMRLLVVLQRKVKSVITTAASSGRNRIIQGKISYFIRQSFIEVKSSTCAVWRLR